MNKRSWSSEGKLKQRLIKIKDQEKQKQKQHDRGGKSALSCSCKPSAAAEEQSFTDKRAGSPFQKEVEEPDILE